MKVLEDVDSDGDVDFDEIGCSLKKCPKSNLNKKMIPSFSVGSPRRIPALWRQMQGCILSLLKTLTWPQMRKKQMKTLCIMKAIYHSYTLVRRMKEILEEEKKIKNVALSTDDLSSRLIGIVRPAVSNK